MHILSAASTDRGLRRETNEDSFRIRPTVGLFLVADGMGGHAAGEVASHIAADAIEAFVEHSAGWSDQVTWPYGFNPRVGIDGNRLTSAFLVANRQIQQRSQDEPALHGMATTAVALLLEQPDRNVPELGSWRVASALDTAPDLRAAADGPGPGAGVAAEASEAAADVRGATAFGTAPDVRGADDGRGQRIGAPADSAESPGEDPRTSPKAAAPGTGPGSGDAQVLKALVAHVGDSRAYLWRERKLEQITRDHSWVEEQVAAGTLTEEDARHHPWRNLVTRALAGAEDPDVDVTPLALEPGDRVLLCSDGLSTPVADLQIAGLFADAPAGDVGGLCSRLVAAANAAGGPDNITVIVIEVIRD